METLDPTKAIEPAEIPQYVQDFRHWVFNLSCCGYGITIPPARFVKRHIIDGHRTGIFESNAEFDAILHLLDPFGIRGGIQSTNYFCKKDGGEIIKTVHVTLADGTLLPLDSKDPPHPQPAPESASREELEALTQLFDEYYYR